MLGTLGITAVGFLGKYNSGWPNRLPEQALMLSTKAKVWEERPANRFINSENGYVYLLGDSYAAQLVNALNEKLFSQNFGFYSNFFWGCPPVQGVFRPGMKNGELCLDYSRDVYNFAYTNNDIQYVVLFANWSMYVADNILEVTGHEANFRSYESDSDRISAVYAASIKTLLDAGKHVVLVYPVPGSYVDVPDYLLKKAFFENVSIENIPPTEAALDYSVYKNDQRNKKVFNAFDGIKGRGDLIRIYPEEIFCTSVDQKCITHNNGEIYYYDAGHLSRTGADLLVEKIVEEISRHRLTNSQ